MYLPEQEIVSKDLVVNIAIAAFIMPIILGAILVYIVSAFQNRKFLLMQEKAKAVLRESQIAIEKQKELQAERNRIATEMHDDLGTGLTTINYQVHRLLSISDDDRYLHIAKSIRENAKELVSGMSEIIWAMNDRYDDVSSLVDYLRRLISDKCEELNMPYNVNSDVVEGNNSLTGEKRRNILLITKETLNNSLKYSSAQSIDFDFHVIKDRLSVKFFQKGGKGFDPKELMHKGNGLTNIERRLTMLNGKSHYMQNEYGMIILYEIPV